MRKYETEMHINFARTSEDDFDVVAEYILAGDKPIVRSIVGYALKINSHGKTVRVGEPIDLSGIISFGMMEDEIRTELELEDAYTSDYHNRVRAENRREDGRAA